jgi:hypothetical protein
MNKIEFFLFFCLTKKTEAVFRKNIFCYNKIESGLIKKPSVLLIVKIAKVLGVNIEELVNKIQSYA